MNRSRFSGKNQNSVSFRTQAYTLGPISNTITLIVLACLLGLLYLTQVTKTNAYGFQINSLQQSQSQLQTQYNNLQVASARLQALTRVESSAVAKNLVSVAPSATIQH
jgi:cell division protein FtsL